LLLLDKDKCDDNDKNNYKIVKEAIKPTNSKSICSASFHEESSKTKPTPISKEKYEQIKSETKEFVTNYIANVTPIYNEFKSKSKSEGKYAVIIVPGSFNPIHKGHISMFNNAHKYLHKTHPQFKQIFGVYVLAPEIHIAKKLCTTENCPTDDQCMAEYGKGTLISFKKRYELCTSAFSDAKLNGYVFVYPMECGNAMDVVKDLFPIVTRDGGSNFLFYILCGIDHVYDDKRKIAKAGSDYLKGANVIVVSRDGIELTKNHYIQNVITKVIGKVDFIDNSDNAEESSSKVRDLYTTPYHSHEDCEIAKAGLKKLLTESVYEYVLENLMSIHSPDCSKTIDEFKLATESKKITPTLEETKLPAKTPAFTPSAQSKAAAAQLKAIAEAEPSVEDEAANTKAHREASAILNASIKSIESVINQINTPSKKYLVPIGEKMTELLKIMKEINMK